MIGEPRSSEFQKRVQRFLWNHPEFTSTSNGRFTVKRSPYRIRIPMNLNTDLCRITGIIHGDGNMSGRRVLITDQSEGYHKRVVIPFFQKVFGITLNLFHDNKRNSYYSHSKSRIVYCYLVEVLELPQGAVRPNIRIPQYIAIAPLTLQASYVAGLFDAESHVRQRQVEIDFYTTTPELKGFITQYLDQIAVQYGEMTRERDNNIEYEISITERNNVHAFIEATPMKHPDKLRTLQKHFPSD